MSLGEVRPAGHVADTVEQRTADIIERLNQAESDLVNSLDPSVSENGEQYD